MMIARYRNLAWFAIGVAIIWICVLLGVGRADTEPLGDPKKDTDKKAEEKYKPFECPKTHISNQDKCFNCHVTPSFAIKECRETATYDFPNIATSIKTVNGKPVGVFFLTDIADEQLRDSANYFYHHKVENVLIDIHSPGGSLFDAWRIKGIIDEMIGNGIRVETRVYGMAFSAGFLIFCAGQDRVATETAELMWHELITGEMFAIKTPADKEDEAKILRHLQDTANNWMVTRSKVGKDELDAKIRKKEFWISGKEAFNMGFATKLIGK